MTLVNIGRPYLFGNVLSLSGSYSLEARARDNTTSSLRIELIPGSGEVVAFFLGGDRADSLQYREMTFRRR